MALAPPLDADWSGHTVTDFLIEKSQNVVWYVRSMTGTQRTHSSRPEVAAPSSDKIQSAGLHDVLAVAPPLPAPQRTLISGGRSFPRRHC